MLRHANVATVPIHATMSSASSPETAATSTSDRYSVVTQDLRVQLGQREVLRGVDLKVKRGQLHMLLGPVSAPVGVLGPV